MISTFIALHRAIWGNVVKDMQFNGIKTFTPYVKHRAVSKLLRDGKINLKIYEKLSAYSYCALCLCCKYFCTRCPMRTCNPGNETGLTSLYTRLILAKNRGTADYYDLPYDDKDEPLELATMIRDMPLDRHVFGSRSLYAKIFGD